MKASLLALTVSLTLLGCGDPAPNQAIGTELSIEVCAPTGTFSANIIATGKPTTVPFGTFTDTVHTSEWTPLEPGHLISIAMP